MSRQTTLVFLGIAHFLDHFFMLIFPTAVLVIHLEWGMGYEEALAYGTALFAAFALGTMPSGWLGDKWGLVPMMRVYFPALGLASIATAFADGPIALAIGLAAIGLAASIYHPVANALIVRLAERRGRALAANGVCGNFGVAGAALVTGLLAESFGWRVAFLIPGIVAVAIGVLFLWMARNGLAEDTAASVATQDRNGAQAAGSFSLTPGLVGILAALCVMALFGGLVFNGVTIAVPQLLSESLANMDVSIGDVGIIAALVFAIGGFAQLPVGHLLDRVGPRPLLMTVAGCQIPLLLFIGFGEALAVPVALAVLVMFIFGEVPIGSWLIGHYIAPEWRSRIYAVQTLLGLGVGAAAVPLIALAYGWIGDMGLVFTMLVPAALAVFIAALTLPGIKQLKQPIGGLTPAE